MKASQLPIQGTVVRIETPTDAISLIDTPYQLTIFIMDFGNVEVEYDSENDIYRVPVFAERIARYNDMKSRTCSRYGCE